MEKKSGTIPTRPDTHVVKGATRKLPPFPLQTSKSLLKQPSGVSNSDDNVHVVSYADDAIDRSNRCSREGTVSLPPGIREDFRRLLEDFEGRALQLIAACNQSSNARQDEEVSERGYTRVSQESPELKIFVGSCTTPRSILAKVFEAWRFRVCRRRTRSENGDDVERSVSQPDSLRSRTFNLLADEQDFELLPIWQRLQARQRGDAESRSASRRRRISTSPVGRLSYNRLVNPTRSMTNGMESHRCAVANPMSPYRLAWELLGTIFVVCDIILIPLQFFDMQMRPLTTILACVTATYWTLDLPASFLVGYHVDGFLETRLSYLAWHYIRTWFVFDFVLASADWMMFGLELHEQTSGETAASMGENDYVKVGRALRIFRLVRLLRILKLSGLFSKMLDQINSEHILTLLQIGRITVLIVIVNHFIACGFYGIGNAGFFPHANWIKENFGPNDSFGYRYATSLHWSLTQFTPASMEVHPLNTVERVYNVCALIFAMIVFSSFISSITQAMTHLREIDKKRHDQRAALRHYFFENHISVEISSRVWRYLEQSAMRGQKRKMWRDIALFESIPENLQVDIRCEVYRPSLVSHPFFHAYYESNPPAMRAICSKAIEELSLTPGQDLFAWGTHASNMYFVLEGSLDYFMKVPEHDRPRYKSTITKGQWASEAALWIRWFHMGNLVTKTDSLVVRLSINTLHAIMEQYMDTLESCSMYAQMFVPSSKFGDRPISDLVDGPVAVHQLDLLARRAFHPESIGEELDDEDDLLDSSELKRMALNKNSWGSFMTRLSTGGGTAGRNSGLAVP